VASAPLPPRIIEKCLPSDRIVIDTIVSQYCNRTPLHRPSVILQRDIGLAISRATLDGWVLKVGELVMPMAAAMRQELISGSYIQADETVTRCTDRDRTTKRISGNTAAAEELSCSTSVQVVDAMDQSGLWDSSKAFCKLMAMQPMIRSVGREWSMPRVGARSKTVFRGGVAKSTRPSCNSDSGADGRTVCRRRRTSPQRTKC
jgi:Transposase IS66 family